MNKPSARNTRAATLFDAAIARDFASLLPPGKIDSGLSLLQSTLPFHIHLELIDD